MCGHPIAWHFEVENTENNTLEILGSEHITNWMIIRHLRENKGIPEDVALRGEGIEMGGLTDLVSSKAKGVMTKVIDEQEKDVRLGSGFGGRREAEEEREDDRDSSHVRLLRGAGRRGDTKNTHPALITVWSSVRPLVST